MILTDKNDHVFKFQVEDARQVLTRIRQQQGEVQQELDQIQEGYS